MTGLQMKRNKNRQWLGDGGYNEWKVLRGVEDGEGGG